MRGMALVWLCACAVPDVPARAPPAGATATIRETLALTVARAGCGEDEGEPATERAVYGDLDGDGREDAIAVVRCSNRWSVYTLDAYAMRDRPVPLARSIVRVLGNIDPFAQIAIEDRRVLVEVSSPLEADDTGRDRRTFRDLVRLRWQGGSLAPEPIAISERIAAIRSSAALQHARPDSYLERALGHGLVLVTAADADSDDAHESHLDLAVGWLVSQDGAAPLVEHDLWRPAEYEGGDPVARRELSLDRDPAAGIATLRDGANVVGFVRATRARGLTYVHRVCDSGRLRLGTSVCGPIAVCGASMAALEIHGSLGESDCVGVLSTIEDELDERYYDARQSLSDAAEDLAPAQTAPSCAAPSPRDVARARTAVLALLRVEGARTPAEIERAFEGARVGCVHQPSRALLVELRPPWADETFGGAVYRVTGSRARELRRFSWEYMTTRVERADVTGDEIPEIFLPWQVQDAMVCGHDLISPAWDDVLRLGGCSYDRDVRVVVSEGAAAILMADGSVQAWNGAALAPLAAGFDALREASARMLETQRARRAWGESLTEQVPIACEERDARVGEVAEQLVAAGLDEERGRALAADLVAAACAR